MKYITKSFFIKVCCSICFLVLLYYKFNVTFDRTLLLKISLLNYSTYGILTLSILYIKACKWHILLRATNSSNTGFFIDFQAILLGTIVGGLTPATTGEVFRNLYYENKIKSTFLVIVDKFFDFMSLIALLLISLGFFHYYSIVFSIILICIVTLSISRLSLTIIRQMRIKISYKEQLYEKFVKIKSILASINKERLLIIVLLGLLYHILIAFRVLFLFNIIFGIYDVSIFFAVPIISIVAIIPISLGGLGLREGFGSYFLAQNLGIPINVSFNIFIINFMLLYVVQILLFLGFKGLQKAIYWGSTLKSHGRID